MSILFRHGKFFFRRCTQCRERVFNSTLFLSLYSFCVLLDNVCVAFVVHIKSDMKIRMCVFVPLFLRLLFSRGFTFFVSYVCNNTLALQRYYALCAPYLNIISCVTSNRKFWGSSKCRLKIQLIHRRHVETRNTAEKFKSQFITSKI